MAAAWLAGIDRAPLCAVTRATFVTITSVAMLTISTARLMMRTTGRASRWCSRFIEAPVGAVCTVRSQNPRKTELHFENRSDLDGAHLSARNGGRQLRRFLLVFTVEHVVPDHLLLSAGGWPR